MRIAPWWVAGLALAAVAGAQERRTPAQVNERLAEQQRQFAIVERAYELRPRRRDEPLRYVNLSDNEMREIQQVAARHLAKTMLNVSPVIEGCACEEGPLCTDQVYVVTYVADTAMGLQLSRVKNVWQVGVVQLWWARYDALQGQRIRMNFRAFDSARSELFREFPSCVGELVTADTTASTPKAETAK
jgi:hypothetical protein